MIEFAPHPNGVIIRVRAQPRARRQGIVGEHAGALKLATTAPPQDGKANQAIAALLAKLFDLARSQVQIVSGATSREKRFLLLNQSEQDIAQKLSRLNATEAT
jgi:uncharacterized protein (TIGR00251 family)